MNHSLLLLYCKNVHTYRLKLSTHICIETVCYNTLWECIKASVTHITSDIFWHYKQTHELHDDRIVWACVTALISTNDRFSIIVLVDVHLWSNKRTLTSQHKLHVMIHIMTSVDKLPIRWKDALHRLIYLRDFNEIHDNIGLRTCICRFCVWRRFDRMASIYSMCHHTPMPSLNSPSIPQCSGTNVLELCSKTRLRNWNPITGNDRPSFRAFDE